MIWTALYANKTAKTFTTENNCIQEATRLARAAGGVRQLFAIMKGNQDPHFATAPEKNTSELVDPFDEYIPNDPRNW